MSRTNIAEDNDLMRVMERDGVSKIVLTDFENLASVNISEIKRKMGKPSWAVRVAYNELFGGVLICQNPGEGNRLHYHGDADECWVIMEGTWEWYIEGVGTRKVAKGDIVVVKKGIKHKITCIGTTPGIRFAITKPDVKHTYI